MNELIKLELVNYNQDLNQIVVSSKEVADHFEKRHDHVFRDIENLVQKDSPKIGEMFFEHNYQDKYNRSQKCYLMNRDGFSLLVMGFTGEKALNWKIKYIEAFNLMEKEYNSPEKIMARALQIAQEELSTLRLTTQVQQQQIQEMQPKVSYYDLVLQSPDLMTVTQIAKDYGESAKSFNQILHENKIQFKQNGTWLLYQQYANQGYTKTKTQTFEKKDGSQGTNVHTYWTQKGRLFLYDLLKGKGVLPIIEQ